MHDDGNDTRQNARFLTSDSAVNIIVNNHTQSSPSPPNGTTNHTIPPISLFNRVLCHCRCRVMDATGQTQTYDDMSRARTRQATLCTLVHLFAPHVRLLTRRRHFINIVTINNIHYHCIRCGRGRGRGLVV